MVLAHDRVSRLGVAHAMSCLLTKKQMFCKTKCKNSFLKNTTCYKHKLKCQNSSDIWFFAVKMNGDKVTTTKQPAGGLTTLQRGSWCFFLKTSILLNKSEAATVGGAQQQYLLRRNRINNLAMCEAPVWQLVCAKASAKRRFGSCYGDFDYHNEKEHKNNDPNLSLNDLRNLFLSCVYEGWEVQTPRDGTTTATATTTT